MRPLASEDANSSLARKKLHIRYHIYANACFRELQSRGLHVQPRKLMSVFYRGEPMGTVKLNHLLVEGCIMVFPVALRATAQIQPEPLRRWMASQSVPLGILANFHSEHLEPVFMKEIS